MAAKRQMVVTNALCVSNLWAARAEGMSLSSGSAEGVLEALRFVA